MDFVSNLIAQGAFSTVVALAVVYYIGRELRALRYEISNLIVKVVEPCARRSTR